ncbi:MAG: hypothetical protein ACK5IC_00055 [Moheibacter sp.]
MLTKKCVIQISILVITGVQTVFGQQQFRSSDFGLIGKVESLQSVTVDYSMKIETKVSGFLDSEMFDSIYLKFDKQRSLVLRENYLNYRGKLGLFNQTEFQYNFQNQIEKLQTILIQNGEEPRRITQLKTFFYLKNNLIRIDEYNSGRTTDQNWIVNYVYNGGNITEKVFWMEDAIFSTSKFEYDYNGEILSEKSFHNNGVLGKTIQNEYNQFGQIEKKVVKSGNEMTRETFEYGTVYKSSTKITDKSGNTLRAEIFDKRGLVKEIQKINYQTNQVDSYQFYFELDNVGNWTKCEIRKNNIPTYITNRKINYY